MSKALIHIGAHKSGSTYLQTLVRANHEELLSGEIHPLRGISPNTQPDSIFQIHLKKEIRQFRQALKRKDNNFEYKPQNLHEKLKTLLFDNCLLSCESLEHLTIHHEAFNAFHRQLTSTFKDVSYFYVIRNLIKLRSSALQDCARSLRLTGYINIDRMVGEYSLDWQLNGLISEYKNLNIYSFENNICQQNQNFLRDLIVEYFQCDLKSFNDVPAANTSVGAEGVASLLCLRFLMIKQFGLELTEAIINHVNFVQYKKEIVQGLRDYLPSKSNFVPFGEEQQIDNIKKARKNSERIINKYGGEWVETAFNQNAVPQSIVYLQELESTDQSTILQLVQESFEKIIQFAINEKFIKTACAPDESLKEFLDNERIIVNQ